MAQSNAVQSAINYLKFDDLDKAKEAIDRAAVNETTIAKPKTWFYRGKIYHALYESTNSKFASLKPGSLEEARISYEKVIELDSKEEYKQVILESLDFLSKQSLNEGVDYFKNSDFKSAIKAFGTSVDISNRYFGRIDTLGIINRAFAAEKSGDIFQALQDYNTLADLGYEGPKMYSRISRLNLSQNDTAAALSALTKGQDKFPGEGLLITDELNIYLSSGRDKEAYEKNEQAISASPINEVLYYIKGNLADKMGKKEESISAYKKAIELKPDYFDANYNLGAMFFNDGAEMANQANKIPTSKQAEYDAAKKKFDAKFQEALPYLEKAHKLNPEDAVTMQSLRQLYTRLGDLTKAGEMKRKLESQAPGK